MYHHPKPSNFMVNCNILQSQTKVTSLIEEILLLTVLQLSVGIVSNSTVIWLTVEWGRGNKIICIHSKLHVEF